MKFEGLITTYGSCLSCNTGVILRLAIASIDREALLATSGSCRNQKTVSGMSGDDLRSRSTYASQYVRWMSEEGRIFCRWQAFIEFPCISRYQQVYVDNLP